MRIDRVFTLLLASALVSFVTRSTAWAQVDEEVPPALGSPTEATPSDTSTQSTTELSDEQALLEEQAPAESGESGLDPREREGENYYFIGLLARGLVVPAFIQNIFVATGQTPVNGGFGAFFNYRKNGFNVQLELNYQGFGVDGVYRGIDQPEFESERILSRLGLIYGNVSFSWAFDITDWFAFELGFGIGLGGLVGDLYRQAVVQTADGSYVDCTGPGRGIGGNPESVYCGPNEWETGDRPGPNGDAYQITEGRPNPHYFGDRGIPPIFFNIDLPRIAFRFKPIRQIQLRADFAYNLYGFSFGASAGYGF